MKKILSFVVALLATYTSFAGPTFDCDSARAAFTASLSYNSTFVVLVNNQSIAPSSSATAIYSYNYADGSPTTDSSSHVYFTAGTYNIRMIAEWTNPIDSSKCRDTAYDAINVGGTMQFDCANGSVNFYTSVTYKTVQLVNASYPPTPTSQSTYVYNFGDGSGVTTVDRHTYTTPGSYNIYIYTEWQNLLDLSMVCRDTTIQIINISSAAINCDSANASFYTSVTNSTVGIYNTSTPPAPFLIPSYTYDYGDGSAPDKLGGHTYATAGTYTISMIALWLDPADTITVLCSDTVANSVTVGALLQRISGMVSCDSSSSVAAYTSYKVWLIKYDSTAGTLTAVDSVVVNGDYYNNASFSFNNEAPATYLIKAQQVDSNVTLIPTYGYSSVYWSGADKIKYTGGTVYRNINMIPGTPPAGPGFIGGSISAGANRLGRRTGNDVTDILILLRNSAGIPIASVRTDANGQYYFANIANGSYDVYPELPGYGTIVFPVSVGTGSDTAKNINFHINTTTKQITPTPTGINKIAQEQSLAVYPNPTTGIINVRSEQITGTTNITISDVVGRKVWETQINNMTGTTPINLSSLNAGVYFINIKAEGVNYSNKIVLQH